MRVSGATAVITGGASGLGGATARSLHREGANVVLVVDINADKGRKLAQELGERVEFIHADVTSAEQMQAAMDLATTKFGGLHILVNCAGIFLGERTISRSGPHDLERFKEVINTNLVGPAQPRREGDRLGLGAADLLGQRAKHRRIE